MSDLHDRRRRDDVLETGALATFKTHGKKDNNLESGRCMSGSLCGLSDGDASSSELVKRGLERGTMVGRRKNEGGVKKNVSWCVTEWGGSPSFGAIAAPMVNVLGWEEEKKGSERAANKRQCRGFNSEFKLRKRNSEASIPM